MMMNIESALTTILVNEHPQFLQISKSSQKQVIKKLIKTAVSQALQQIHLPPMKDIFQRKLDEYHYNRSSAHYRQNHKLTNYVLLQKLYDLRTKEANSNGTDFLKMLQIEASTFRKQLLDNMLNIERPHHVDFENFSENDVRKKIPFFKLSKIDYSIFNSEKDTRNYITRFGYKLSEGVNISLIVSTCSSNQILQESLEDHTFSKNQKFTEDLFVLYDLQLFLNFIHMLEKASISVSTLKDSLDYAYHVLHNYYHLIFKTHDHEFKNDELLEYILQDDDFRKLSDENPLSQGFIMLFSHSINVPQLLKKIDDE